jgi:hypothetical protein
MKLIALAITIFSGLCLGGKAHAEGVGRDSATPDSSKFNAIQIAEFELVSEAAGAAADALTTDPSVISTLQQADEETSKDFEMEMTSYQAGLAAAALQRACD